MLLAQEFESQNQRGLCHLFQHLSSHKGKVTSPRSRQALETKPEPSLSGKLGGLQVAFSRWALALGAMQKSPRHVTAVMQALEPSLLLRPRVHQQAGACPPEAP